MQKQQNSQQSTQQGLDHAGANSPQTPPQAREPTPWFVALNDVLHIWKQEQQEKGKGTQESFDEVEKELMLKEMPHTPQEVENVSKQRHAGALAVQALMHLPEAWEGVERLKKTFQDPDRLVRMVTHEFANFVVKAFVLKYPSSPETNRVMTVLLDSVVEIEDEQLKWASRAFTNLICAPNFGSDLEDEDRSKLIAHFVDPKLQAALEAKLGQVSQKRAQPSFARVLYHLIQPVPGDSPKSLRIRERAAEMTLHRLKQKDGHVVEHFLSTQEGSLLAAAMFKYNGLQLDFAKRLVEVCTGRIYEEPRCSYFFVDCLLHTPEAAIRCLVDYKAPGNKRQAFRRHLKQRASERLEKMGTPEDKSRMKTKIDSAFKLLDAEQKAASQRGHSGIGKGFSQEEAAGQAGRRAQQGRGARRGRRARLAFPEAITPPVVQTPWQLTPVPVQAPVEKGTWPMAVWGTMVVPCMIVPQPLWPIYHSGTSMWQQPQDACGQQSAEQGFSESQEEAARGAFPTAFPTPSNAASEACDTRTCHESFGTSASSDEDCWRGRQTPERWADA